MPFEVAPTPPVNLDAEESVLGAMMLSPRAIEAVTEEVSAEDFYRRSHEFIFTAAVALHAAGEPVDAITVSALLERNGGLETAGGTDRIHELAAIVPATGNARHYARIVREMASLRKLLGVGEQIQRGVWDRVGTAEEQLGEAQRLLFGLTKGAESKGLVTSEQAALETLERLTALYEEKAPVVGLPTGFAEIDKMTSGLRSGQMIVVAGRPSMGKSALALGIVANTAIRGGLPVLLFTYEMNRQEVIERLLAMESHLASDLIQTPSRLMRGDWDKVAKTSGVIAQAPLFLDDSRTTTMVGVRTISRRLKLQHPSLALVVIDYLQLMESGASRYENRTLDVGTMSRELKMMAGELGIPVLVLSQLSRGVESRHDKRPMLSDLRDSGTIEQDADVVMLLYRGSYYHIDREDLKGIAEVDIAKHRNGPVGMRKLAFVERYAKFSDLDWRSE